MQSVKAIIEQAKADQRAVLPVDQPPEHIAPASATPTLLEQETLEWYLGQGQAVFERSPTGAVLDLVAMRAYSSVKCRDCDGSGILGYQENKETIRLFNLDRLMTLWQQNEKKPVRAAIERALRDCPECEGTGAKPVKNPAQRQRYSKEAPFRPLDPVDVKPRASAQFSLKSAPDDENLTRYASVSRRLSRLPMAVQRVLRAAYGIEGQSWADVEERGRVWAVLQLTDIGARIVRENPGLIPDQNRVERLDDIAKLQELKPLGQRSGSLGDAVRAANALLVDAVSAWNELVRLEGT